MANTQSLHFQLSSHKFQHVTDALKAGTIVDFSVENPQGYTLLQHAAAEGAVEPLLWLINSDPNIHQNNNANKAFFYAVMNGHWLAAQVLAICGARLDSSTRLQIKNNIEVQNRFNQFCVDTDILRGVYYWVLAHREIFVKKKLPNRLMDYIVQAQATSLVTNNVLIPITDEKESATQPLIELALAAVVIDEKPYSPLTDEKSIPPQQDKTLTMDLCGFIELAAQLDDEKLMTNYFNLNEKHVRVVDVIPSWDQWYFIHHPQSELPALMSEAKQIDTDVRNIMLTSNQKKIYHAAKSAHKNQLKNPINKEQQRDFLAVLDFSFVHRDFVAVNVLLNYIKPEILFRHLYDTKQRDLFILCMFAHNKYSYEMIFLLGNDFQSFFQFLGNHHFELLGITYRLVSHGISGASDQRTQLERNRSKDFLKFVNCGINEFVAIYFQKYFLQHEINSPQKALTWLNENSDREHRSAFISRASRYGFTIKNHENIRSNTWDQFFSHGHNSPAGIVVSFLDEKSVNSFSRVSRGCCNVVSGNNRKINNFLLRLQNEIHQKPRFSKSSLYLKVGIYYMVLLASAIIAVYYALKGNAGSNQTLEDMKNYQLSYNTCYENGYPGEHRLTWTDNFGFNKECYTSSFAIDYHTDPRCQPFCDSQKKYYGMRATGITFAVTSALVAIISTALFFVCLCCKAFPAFCLEAWNGRKRFDNAPLTDFSLELQSDATKLFSELGLEHLSTATSVAIVRDELNRVKINNRVLPNVQPEEELENQNLLVR